MQTGSSADLTNLVISTLIETDEARMSAKTKVLLSVKYRRSDAMQRVLIKEGIEIDQKNDISKDPRPLQYAAYHDLDLTFDHLRSHGFDSAGSDLYFKKGSSHLDTLILAEMHAGFRAAFVEKQLRSTKSVTLRDFNGKNVQTTRVNTVVRPNMCSQGPTWWDASQHPDTKMDWDDPALTPTVREKVIVDHYKQVSWKDVFAVGGHPNRLVVVGHRLMPGCGEVDDGESLVA